MSNEQSRISRVVLFHSNLTRAGGAERLMLEEADYFTKNGAKTHILTFDTKDVGDFYKSYQLKIERIGRRSKDRTSLTGIIKQIYNLFVLRKRLREIRPDIVILANAGDCLYLYLATLFLPFQYACHIHGTIFWIPSDLLKYASIHRRTLNEIMKSNMGHKEFISPQLPKMSLIKRVLLEFRAFATYMSVRKAKSIFVLSDHMKWEVSKLYNKDAAVLKGAFPSHIFLYKPKQNIKGKLGLEDKTVILNVNRLVVMKRVDLLIKAFSQLSKKWDDLVLVIGGEGEEKGKLEELTKKLGLEDKVRFIGYIDQEELWDYYSSCDLFVHPEWADFDIAPYEALALQKKVVWSNEMETDESLKPCPYIFVTEPNADALASVIEKALSSDPAEGTAGYLQKYTWENYCKNIEKTLSEK